METGMLYISLSKNTGIPIIMETVHRRNGFYAVQTVFSIPLF